MADVTFAHYFQAELAYLRDLAQEFGRTFPEVLPEIGRDPARVPGSP
jgi:type VI protein secretion system component VasA